MGDFGKEGDGERKDVSHWLVEGSPHPPMAGPKARAWGRGSTSSVVPRSLYLLENEGFHSSDEGYKRMKHKHSRNSKPQGETPLCHSLHLLGRLAPASGYTCPSASEVH
jgi:hypothetical protein